MSETIIEAIEVKFSNPTDTEILLRVGQGARIADRVYKCAPGGTMLGPVNYTDFFLRNGLQVAPDEDLTPAISTIKKAR